MNLPSPLLRNSCGSGPLKSAGDVDVRQSVLVIIPPGRRQAMKVAPQPGLGRDIGERAGAVVAEKEIGPAGGSSTLPSCLNSYSAGIQAESPAGHCN